MSIQSVKRVKGGKAHYASAFAPGGNATAWTEDPAKALQIGDRTDAERQLRESIVAHYRDIPNVGVMTFEPGGAPINDAAKALAAEAARVKAESDSLATLRAKADRCDAVDAVRIRLEREANELRAKALAAEAALTEAKKEIESLKNPPKENRHMPKADTPTPKSEPKK